MKKLGRIRTVLRRIAARGLRIHPVDSQQPAPGRAILAQPVKIDAISSSEQHVNLLLLVHFIAGEEQDEDDEEKKLTISTTGE